MSVIFSRYLIRLPFLTFPAGIVISIIQFILKLNIFLINPPTPCNKGSDAVSWSKESFKLAREKVYLNGELNGSTSKENALPVPEDYGKESKRVGEQQVSLAGYRLASLVGHTYRSKSLTLFPCADGEANQDIVRSVNNIKKKLSDYDISWEQEEDDKCGYLLRFGEREKFIKGAMTDVDLWMEIMQFFEI